MALLLSIFIALGAFVPLNLVLYESTILTVLVNGTHFMASYRLLYDSWANVMRYKVAAIVLPIGLLGYGATALAVASVHDGQMWMVDGIIAVAALYLALHYTGQAWGMMASFAFLEAIPFEKGERTAIRVCLRVLALWQMGWAVTTVERRPEWLEPWFGQLLVVLHCALVLTLPVGAYVMWLSARRSGRPPSLRIWVPYFSLYVWYGFLWIYPQSIFWVQIAHSIQYLPFTSRVELNRIGPKAAYEIKWREMLQYLLVLVLTSTLVFGVTPWAMRATDPNLAAYWVVLASIINIHHFFIDGCIWHIRNPDVRRSLFAHV
jgi:hypothetical protein